jgi:hypothetical protein
MKFEFDIEGALQEAKNESAEKVETTNLLSIPNREPSGTSDLGMSPLQESSSNAPEEAKQHSHAMIEDDIDISPAIAIAIDHKTGSALLLFKESDSEIVRDVADVHRKPFKVPLTPKQRKEIRDSLEYLNQINSRKGKA